MNDKTNEERRELSFLTACVLFLYLFYYSYRYILRFNSESTSPTYSNTPFSLQIFKYIILALLCVLLIIANFNKKISPAPAVFFCGVALFMGQNAYSFLFTRSTDYVISVICFLPLLIILFFKNEIELSPVDRVLEWFLNFTIVYEFLQILLYFAFGRLPALAYATGHFTDVRFGGAWDDPNGFSILLSLYIPYVAGKFDGKKRIIYLIILFVFLLFTWSMTGILSFALAAAIFFFVYFVKRKRFTKKSVKIFLCVLVFLPVALLFAFYAFSDVIVYLLSSKMGSIASHLSGWEIDTSFLALFGLKPSAKFAEAGFISLINHGGIFYMLLFYLLSFYGIVKTYREYLRAKKEGDGRAHIFGAALFYEVAYLIASINLPVPYMFPNLGIFVLTFVFTLRGKQYEMKKKIPEGKEMAYGRDSIQRRDARL